MPEVPLRIHFASIHDGGGPSPWRNHSTLIVDPAAEHRADILHVLHPDVDEEQSKIAATVFFLEEQSEGAGLDARFHAVDFDNPARAAARVGRLIGEYDGRVGHRIHYNLSCGPRESVLVGLLVAQYWPVSLYVTRLDMTSEQLPDTNQWPYERTEDFPSPSPLRLDPGVLACLQVMATDGAAKQRHIIDKLVALGVIKAEGKNEHQRTHSAFQQYAKRLANLELAEKEGTGKNCRWILTETGRHAAVVMDLEEG